MQILPFFIHFVLADFDLSRLENFEELQRSLDQVIFFDFRFQPVLYVLQFELKKFHSGFDNLLTTAFIRTQEYFGQFR